MKHTVLACLIMIYLITGGAAHTQPSPAGLRLDLSATASAPTIGDSLTVILTVVRPDSILTRTPAPAASSPLVEFHQPVTETTATADGDTTLTYRYPTYIFAPDSVTVGPFSVEYVTAAGDSGAAMSGTVDLRVSGVLVAQGNRPPLPRPDRPPVAVPFSGVPLWTIVAIALAVAALVWFFLRHYRRREEAGEPEPEGPVDEIGVFEQIRNRHYEETGEVKQLYIEVSDALRGFIHRNMTVDAIYETTWEIMQHLSQSAPENVTRAFREVLTESDMVKFARYTPTGDEMSSVIDRSLVPVRTVLEEQEKRRREREAAEAATSGSGPAAPEAPDETATTAGGGETTR